MRIYHVSVEHKDFGQNWTSYDILANDFEDCLVKIKKQQILGKEEFIEEIELLASADF